MRARLSVLGPRAAEAAYRFCASRAPESAYIAGWIHEGGLAEDPRVPRASLLADIGRAGDIRGLVYVSESGIAIPLLGGDGCLDEIVRVGARSLGALRVIVGERGVVDRLWERLAKRGHRLRVRRDQTGYMVRRSELVEDRDPLSLTTATSKDLDRVVLASAAMAREEAGDDPHGRNPELFRARIAQRLERSRDFVHVDRGVLVFKANVSALSPMCGQIEGVYTEPRFRGAGVGRRGTLAVTRWVLARAEQAFLLVNDDNEPARRLYRALGYTPVMQSQTLFIH